MKSWEVSTSMNRGDITPEPCPMGYLSVSHLLPAWIGAGLYTAGIVATSPILTTTEKMHTTMR
jgi:hypothetical protein